LSNSSVEHVIVCSLLAFIQLERTTEKTITVVVLCVEVNVMQMLMMLRINSEVRMTRDRLTQFLTKQYNGGITHQEGGTT
jgi:hypothetical protein